MIMLVIIPFEEYMSKIIDILKEVYLKDNEKICYISLNKPAKSLFMTFQQKGIDNENLYIIDTVTKTVIASPPPLRNCTYVSSPVAFNEILESISTDLIKMNFGIIVFDSISTQLIYEKESTVLNFMRTLSTKISVIGCEGLFPALKEDINEFMNKNISLIVEKTLDLTK